MKVNNIITKVHSKELHNFSSSLNIIWAIRSKGMRYIGYPDYTGDMRNAYTVLVEKTGRNMSHGRSRHRYF